MSNTGISPKKVRPTVDLVRGRKVDEALTILKFMPSPTARCIEKVIGSAIANAENNQQLSDIKSRISIFLFILIVLINIIGSFIIITFMFWNSLKFWK